MNIICVISLLMLSCNSGMFTSKVITEKHNPQFVEGTVVTFDMTYLNKLNPGNSGDACTIWDNVHTVATLQGIVNRKEPQLYLFYIENKGVNIDRYWWNKYREYGGFLSKAHVKQISDIVSLVEQFKKEINGAVVYDPNVAATSNLASSVAGVENLIAIRYDLSPSSLYSKLVLNGPKIPVKIWLVNKDGTPLFTGYGKIPGTKYVSSGSTKNDAYRWLIENYLKKGKFNTRYGAYYIDQKWLKKPTAAVTNHHTLSNHDFFVSKKSIFFDLSPWCDEFATDDPGQQTGADCKILKEILLQCYKQNSNGKYFTYLGGFPPWAFKYTQHDGGIHEDVETEWEYSRIISSYNAFDDADAIGFGALANASFWQHYPLQDEYPQKWTTKEKLQKNGYLDYNGNISLGNKQLIVFYVGDYDSSSWLSQTTPSIWDDPARGKIPLMWAISPVLSERVPMAWEYRRKTATKNDYFVAADNGAGYLNPGELQMPRMSGLDDATKDWAAHCKPYYKRWGLTVTGFVIDGFADGLNKNGLDAYREFSPNGIVPQKVKTNMLYRDMPVIRSGWDVNDSDPKVAAAHVAEHVVSEQMPFHWFRNILKSPEWYKQVAEELKRLNPNIVIVDAPTFFELYRIFLKKQNQ